MNARVGMDREAILQFKKLVASINVSLIESDFSNPVDQCYIIKYFLEGQLSGLFALPFIDGQCETAAIVSSLLEQRSFLSFFVVDPANRL